MGFNNENNIVAETVALVICLNRSLTSQSSVMVMSGRRLYRMGLLPKIRISC